MILEMNKRRPMSHQQSLQVSPSVDGLRSELTLPGSENQAAKFQADANETANLSRDYKIKVMSIPQKRLNKCEIAQASPQVGRRSGSSLE